MEYETDCTRVNLDEWDLLMKGARKCSYKKLIAKIKRELPGLYDSLCLQFPNPFAEQSKQTKTHYILVHSSIEYFIKK